MRLFSDVAHGRPITQLKIVVSKLYPNVAICEQVEEVMQFVTAIPRYILECSNCFHAMHCRRVPLGRQYQLRVSTCLTDTN